MTRTNTLIIAAAIVVAAGLVAGINVTAQPERGNDDERRGGGFNVYEHAVLPIEELRRGRADQYAPVIEDEINELASVGWELVATDDEFLVFRRRARFGR